MSERVLRRIDDLMLLPEFVAIVNYFFSLLWGSNLVDRGKEVQELLVFP